MIRLIFPTIVFAAMTSLISFIVTFFIDVHVKKHTFNVLWQHYSIFLFIIYIMSLISVTLINRKINIEQGYNLIPFANFAYDFRYQKSALISLIITNVIMLVPYGFLAPFALKKRGVAFYFLSGVGLIILIEIVQLITGRGTFDVDDIIFNSLGILIGFGLYKLLKRVLSKRAGKSGGAL